jgi:hypothetical protein
VARRWREARGGAAVEGDEARRRWREGRGFATAATTTKARDGGHARTGGGRRLGFATAVTTTEDRGGATVEAKRTMTVEQRPPSLTSRHNRWRCRSSLDGGPLLRQPNDGRHGSGHGDGLLLAQRR